MLSTANDWIAVTGASGFIGRHLVDRLLSENRRVVVISRTRPSNPRLDGAVSAGQARMIMKPEPDRHDLRETGAIVMLAGLAHRSGRTTPATEYVEVNTKLSVRTAKAAIAAGCRRLVYVSTVAVHGDGPFSEPIDETAPIAPTTPYGRSKWQAEQALDGLCREAGATLIRLRPPLVYAPNAPGSIALLRRAIERGIPLPFARIRNRRSVVPLLKLTEVIRAAASYTLGQSKVLLVANPHPVSTPTIASAIANDIKADIKLFPFPPALLAMALTICGFHRLRNQLMNDFIIASQDFERHFGTGIKANDSGQLECSI